MTGAVARIYQMDGSSPGDTSGPCHLPPSVPGGKAQVCGDCCATRPGNRLAFLPASWRRGFFCSSLLSGGVTHQLWCPPWQRVPEKRGPAWAYPSAEQLGLAARPLDCFNCDHRGARGSQAQRPGHLEIPELGRARGGEEGKGGGGG